MTARRVLVVMHPVGRGGAVRSTSILLDALAGSSAHASLVVLDGRAVGRLRSHMPAGLPMTHLGWRSRLHFPLAVWRLGRLLRRQRPDIAIAVNTYAALALLAATLLVRRPPRTIVRELMDPHAMPRRPASVVKVWLARLLYRRAGAVVTASHGMLGAVIRLFRLPPTAVRVIYNGYDPHLVGNGSDGNQPDGLLVPPPPPDGPAHAWLDGRQPTLLYVGRLVPIKGVHLLIGALSLLRESGVEARLLIVGEGPEQGRLEHLAAQEGLSDAICFAGYIERPYGLMAAASTVVVPSLSEAFGNVILEAMRAGAVVVASDCDYGPREIIVPGAGVLVPPGDPAALAGAIGDVLADPELARRLRSGALARAEEFSPGRMVERWSALFDELVPA
jgi:glycosyltransferase involved in cell wall biosynthesis